MFWKNLRRGVFEKFWESGNFDAQNAYLCGCVRITRPKKRYTRHAQSRRNVTRVFYVQDEGFDLRVCKKAFLRIHAISSGRLNRALQARLAEKGSVHMDRRGRHAPANRVEVCSTPFNREKEHKLDMSHTSTACTIHSPMWGGKEQILRDNFTTQLQLYTHSTWLHDIYTGCTIHSP